MAKQFPLLASVTVTTSGTPVQYAPDKITNVPGAPGVGAVPILMKRLEFRPLAANTGTVSICYLQRGTIQKPIVLAAGAFPLVLEAPPHLPFDLNDFYFDASANGQVIMIIGLESRA